jgi:hypothetical protein
MDHIPLFRHSKSRHSFQVLRCATFGCLMLISRIWDVMFIEGEAFLFRVAVGLLKYFTERILLMDYDELMMFTVNIINSS